jgi:hypothetical protein
LWIWILATLWPRMRSVVKSTRTIAWRIILLHIRREGIGLAVSCIRHYFSPIYLILSYWDCLSALSASFPLFGTNPLGQPHCLGEGQDQSSKFLFGPWPKNLPPPQSVKVKPRQIEPFLPEYQIYFQLVE